MTMDEHYDWSMAVLEVKMNITKLNHALLMREQAEARDAATKIIASMNRLLDDL